jgi:Permuted papain-like amidase enzyme, YaeF/YiiX, C92 family
MGVILYRDGGACVLEAVATVRCTPLTRWIARGRSGHFVVKRLKAPAMLSPKAVAALHDEGRRLEGRPYDSAFGWSDDMVYCSELVWKVYDRALGIHIGELQRLRDFNLMDPVVKAKLEQRYGSHIPLDEPVIAPSTMFSSPLLETVAQE